MGVKKYFIAIFLLFFVSLLEANAQFFFSNYFSLNNTITEDSLRIEGRNSIAIPPSYYTIHIDNPYTLPKKIDKTARLPRMFDNIGLWYLIQGIKADMPRDPELKEALTVLTKYMENRRLHEQINAMRRVTMKTEEKVNAINFIQSEITKDSIQSEEEYEGNDLQLLLAAFANDSTFQWLKKISRDSIQLEIIDQNDSLAYAMWINNGMHQYRRLWLKTSSGDSIGTWLDLARR